MAKDTACISFDSDPNARENIARLYVIGTAAGVDLNKRGTTDQSVSAVLCYGARVAVESAETIATLRAEVARLQGITTAPTDAERLKSAMTAAGVGNRDLAAIIGIHHDSIKNARRGSPLTKPLRDWLAGQEAGGAK